jgi:dihydrofolate reductase
MYSKMKINLIVAMSRNNGIGYKGNMPWHIKAELQYFSKLTKGNGNNAIVMGNNTWKSFSTEHIVGLSKRDNFILSNSQTFSEMVTADERLIKVFDTYESFMTFIQEQSYDEVWIIGGAQIYKTFLEKNSINSCYITIIDKDFDCDTYFPELNPAEWQEFELKKDYDTKYDCNVRYLIYERVC